MLLSGISGGFSSGACTFWYGKHSGQYQGVGKDNSAELGYGAATRDTSWHRSTHITKMEIPALLRSVCIAPVTAPRGNPLAAAILDIKVATTPRMARKTSPAK